MNGNRRLLVLSCSQRKHPSREQLPAIERYNGPLFFVLRRFLRECPSQARLLDVLILSAEYGLIPGDFSTAFYDRKMRISRLVELESQITKVFSDIRRENYLSVFFVLGKTYLRAFGEMRDIAPLNSKSKQIVAYGPMGKKQTQLRDWLWRYRFFIHTGRILNEN